ncbi:hypothetical protein K4B79_18615 [Streptomyces lincolnensis]|uniref:hypothetical protein n=1 Tax=Streptomyces lincolnensis TaxID=1915 RepID=UPI001E2F633B|nr:hypothetical protein [Streptomyces lincolnensis]MCD7440228.1 hypothetical protein [Streptomyces lincolnensis]
MAFPEDPLGTTAELGIDDVFTNVTAYTLKRNIITHTRGQKEEGQAVDPASCSLILKSPNGLFSPRNPRSEYFEKIGLNTPTRISVFAGERYLWLPDIAGSGASTPDHASLDITSDIDVRIELTLEPWHGTSNLRELAGKYAGTGNQRSWALFMWIDNRLTWRWSPDGTNVLQYLSTALTIPTSGRLAVRVTLDVDNGAGGHTVTWYTAPTIAGPWTMLGTPDVHAGTTSIFSSTAPLTVGDVTELGFERPVGRAHAFELRSGINGTVVANPDFSLPAAGATSFVDAAGRTWSPSGGAEITNRQIRFVGEFSDWPADWSGRGDLITVEGEAVGILERMNQGKKVLASTLRRRIPSFNPIAYWPMEEGTDATTIYSPIPGVKAFKPVAFDMAADDTLPGSSALPTLEVGASFVAQVPNAPAGSWQVELVYNLDTMPVALTTLFEVRTSGTARRVRARVATNQVTFEGLDADDNVVFTQTTTAPAFTGTWNRLQIKAVQTGGNVEYIIIWVTIGGGGLSTSATIAAVPGSVLDVRSTFGTGLDGMRLGHLAVFTGESTAFNNADHGFNGETAAARMTRLCAEEGVPFRLADPTAETVQLGPQRPGTLLKLLQDCADADGGVFGEERDRLGLRYRARTTLYNQTPKLTLAYGDRGVARPMRPVEPDSSTVRNDVAVNRVAGGTGRAVLEEGRLSVQDPPAGVGLYDEVFDLNLYDDDQAEPTAYWLMHLRTWDEARYPVVTVKLHRAPQLIDTVLGMTEGDMLRITDLPDFLPPGPVDLLVQGYTERLGIYTWEVDFVCVPAGPWRVGVVEDPVVGRADTDLSQLAAAATSTAASVAVSTPSGPWVTAAPVLNANPDFDTGTTGWAGSGGTIARVSAPLPKPFAGSWALQLTPNGVAQFPNAGSATMPVVVGEQYIASGWLLCGIARDIGLNVNWFTTAGAYLSTSANETTVTANVWTWFEATVTAPATALTANLAPTVPDFPPATDVLWLHRVTLRKAGTAAAGDLPRNFPMDVKAGGETMTVSAIEPGVWDTFGRTVASGWGNAGSGQAWTVVGAAADYAVGSGYGSATQPSTGIAHLTLAPAPSADIDLYVDVASSVLASGASLFAGPIVRAVDNNNHYAVRVDFTTSAGVAITVRKRVAGVETQLGTFTSGLTHVAGTFYRVRFQAYGTALKAKVWLASAVEPVAWQIEVTDSSLTAAANVGTRSFANTGSTPVNPQLRFDNFRLADPQTFHVTRSVNGVVKPQAAATKVKLANPTIVAL